MRKLLLALATAGCLVTGLGLAGPAYAATGYHATEVWLVPSGDPTDCLTAASAENNAELYVFGCELGDALQHWTILAISGYTVIALAAHPDLVIGGIPGDRNSVKLIRLAQGEDVPLPQGMFIGGTITESPHASTNTYRNTAGEYMMLPSRGHSMAWARLGLSTVKWTRKWVVLQGFTKETAV